MIERPCPCAYCEARRLAWRLFLAFLVMMAFFGFLHRNDGRGRIEVSPAAYRDRCGVVHPDLLDGIYIRGGTRKRRDNGAA